MNKKIIFLVAVILLIGMLTACNGDASYKISFVVDGEVVHSIDIKSNEEIKMPDNPEKDGYDFVGWYLDKDVWQQQFNETTQVNSDISVYAYWEEISFTISFNSNGGSKVPSINKEQGKTITPPLFPTKTGYVFDGWYTDNDTFNNKYTFDKMPSEDLTLYANWLACPQRIDKDGTINPEGGYFFFGEYPQTIKAENITISQTKDTRGYYLGSDDAYYSKVVADSTFQFSTGESAVQGATYYFRVEPIKWRILNITDDTALILCDSILSGMRFAEESNIYENSEIRAWLLNDFRQEAFDDSQREFIQSEVSEDAIFILNYEDMVNSSYGYSETAEEDLSRVLKPSDYTIAKGIPIADTGSFQGNGQWWLSSPDELSNTSASYVDINGSIQTRMVSNSTGITPALRISLAS